MFEIYFRRSPVVERLMSSHAVVKREVLRKPLARLDDASARFQIDLLVFDSSPLTIIIFIEAGVTFMTTKKILLVIEDEEALQEAVRQKLKKRKNISAFFVSSAEDAYGVLSKNTPDLIWLDLLLPGMGGFSFLEQLRQIPKWKNIPVIIVSVSGSPEKVQRAFDLNVVDYLVKSQYKLEDIFKKIEVLLDKKVALK